MYAARTEYRLASTPASYKICHAFFRAEAQHPQVEKEGLESIEYQTERISYPTVYAVRDNTTIAVMATKLVPGFGLVAAPFHIAYAIKNHVPTALRLMDCYEFFLRQAGIPFYTVIVPNYKSSAVRVFTELRDSDLLFQLHNDRFNVYRVFLPNQESTP